jgi:hypothetical protein
MNDDLDILGVIVGVAIFMFIGYVAGVAGMPHTTIYNHGQTVKLYHMSWKIQNNTLYYQEDNEYKVVHLSKDVVIKCK